MFVSDLRRIAAAAAVDTIRRGKFAFLAPRIHRSVEYCSPLKAHFSQVARDDDPFAGFSAFDSVRAVCHEMLFPHQIIVSFRSLYALHHF
jgi:hypothetical protein